MKLNEKNKNGGISSFRLICKLRVLLQECGLNKGMNEPENGVCDSTQVVPR